MTCCGRSRNSPSTSTTSIESVSNPLDRGAAAPVPTRGEGCTRRFDPDAMSDEHGADFADAARLWRALQEQTGATQADSASVSESASVATTAVAQAVPDAGTGR